MNWKAISTAWVVAAVASAALILNASTGANAQSSLPQCSHADKGSWSNCQATVKFETGPNAGNIYIGEFKDGKRSGRGTYTFVNGNKYEGTWVNDLPDGLGTFTYENKRVYIGAFEGGKQTGRGLFKYPDGSMYVGEFKGNKRAGQGTFTFPNGRKIEGAWADDKINGFATEYDSKGAIKQKGIWTNSEFVREAVNPQAEQSVRSATVPPQTTQSNGATDKEVDGSRAILDKKIMDYFELYKQGVKPTVKFGNVRIWGRCGIAFDNLKSDGRTVSAENTQSFQSLKVTLGETKNHPQKSMQSFADEKPYYIDFPSSSGPNYGFKVLGIDSSPNYSAGLVFARDKARAEEFAALLKKISSLCEVVVDAAKMNPTQTKAPIVTGQSQLLKTDQRDFEERKTLIKFSVTMNTKQAAETCVNSQNSIWSSLEKNPIFAQFRTALSRKDWEAAIRLGAQLRGVDDGRVSFLLSDIYRYQNPYKDEGKAYEFAALSSKLGYGPGSVLLAIFEANKKNDAKNMELLKLGAEQCAPDAMTRYGMRLAYDNLGSNKNLELARKVLSVSVQISQQDAYEIKTLNSWMSVAVDFAIDKTPSIKKIDVNRITSFRSRGAPDVDDYDYKSTKYAIDGVLKVKCVNDDVSDAAIGLAHIANSLYSKGYDNPEDGFQCLRQIGQFHDGTKEVFRNRLALYEVTDSYLKDAESRPGAEPQISGYIYLSQKDKGGFLIQISRPRTRVRGAGTLAGVPTTDYEIETYCLYYMGGLESGSCSSGKGANIGSYD